MGFSTPAVIGWQLASRAREQGCREPGYLGRGSTGNTKADNSTKLFNHCGLNFIALKLGMTPASIQMK